MRNATDRESVSTNGTDGSTGSEDVPDRLLREERKIRRWNRSRLAAGRAMKRISEQGLHRERGYDRIKDYAEELFGIKEARWHQLVRHAETYERLEDHLGEEVPMPENASHTRPLRPHRDDPDFLGRAWKEAVEQHGEDLTRKRVEDVVDELTGEDAGSDGSNDDGQGGASERKTHANGADETPVADTGVPDRREEADLNGGTGPTEKPEATSSDEDDSGSENNSSCENNSSGENEAAESGDADDEDAKGQDADEEKGPLDRKRERHAPLLSGLSDGIAQSILTIGEKIAERSPSLREGIETARANLESLSHRDPPEDGEGKLPACITGSVDAIDDREILIAVPTGLVTPKMAETAVPIGVPQAQREVGVPLSYFDGRTPVKEIRAFYEEEGHTCGFNKTNENVDWAAYTINPITGCLHDCAYCYAWYQAEDLNRYKQGFQPTFFPGRLNAFGEMAPPDETDHIREKNVFVGSMSDIFGKWIPDSMIQAILDEVEANDGFNHLFLTKFPQKLSRFDFPENAWIGTTVDKKHRVDLAERHFRQVDAEVKWLSCEPLKEDVAPKFDDLSIFDCVVIGAQMGYGSDVDEEQPEFGWVTSLYEKAREAGCKVYLKENLKLNFPKELPLV